MNKTKLQTDEFHLLKKKPHQYHNQYRERMSYTEDQDQRQNIDSDQAY